MTEQNQIEKWREQFHKWFSEDSKTGLDRDGNGDYVYISAHVAWNTWLSAKRNMPVIEISAYDMHHYAPVRNLIAQFEALSIQYTIKTNQL